MSKPMKLMSCVFNFWVVFKKAPDVPGAWLAHCLDLDLVTQGDSLPHAVEMIKEATCMTLVDDLSKHLNPHRRRAPKNLWDELWPIVQHGERVDFATVLAEADGHPGPYVAHAVVEVLAVPQPTATGRAVSKKKPTRRTATPAKCANFEPEVAFAAAGA